MLQVQPRALVTWRRWPGAPCCKQPWSSTAQEAQHVKIGRVRAVPSDDLSQTVKIQQQLNLTCNCVLLAMRFNPVCVVAIVLIVPFMCARIIVQCHSLRQTRCGSHGWTLHSVHGVSQQQQLTCLQQACCCLQQLERDHASRPHGYSARHYDAHALYSLQRAHVSTVRARQTRVVGCSRLKPVRTWVVWQIALCTIHARRHRAGSAVQRTCGKCNRSARSLPGAAGTVRPAANMACHNSSS